MPNVERIKNGVVVKSNPKPQIKILRDGNGNAVKIIKIRG